MVRPSIWGCIGLLAQVASGDFVSTDYQQYNKGALGHRPHLEYHSSTEFSPLLQVNVWDADNISDTGSHIFLRHDGNDSSPLSSPLILDSHDLSAVYMNRSFKNVFGTRVQENRGKKYLTFWGGDKGDGIGDGYGLAYDETYRLAYKISAQNIQVHSDLHEFAFTGNGTALVTGVDKIRPWRSELPAEWRTPERFEVLNAVFQEIDLETNDVLFDWRALDHINPMESFEPRGSGWDAYHLNSIQKTKAGNYLISIRHMHAIYLIDGKTGAIIWTLGGPHNDFVELPAAEGVDASAQPILTMGWQHHARYVPGTEESQMTFFDNHVKVTSHGQCDSDCSRGLHIAINDTASPPTVRLLAEFQHPSQLQAQSQGSVQPLSPGTDDLGNVFIGWGRCPSFTEHSSSGETVLDVQFSPWHSDDIPDALDNYRAYKMDWSATPWWDPQIAPRMNAQGELVVYASWNGATEVKTWVVRGASDDLPDQKGQILAVSRRTGFETKLVVGSTDWQYIWAEAVDNLGNVLGWSEAVDLNTAELSVAEDLYDVSETIFPPPRLEEETEESAGGVSKLVVALLSTGLGVFVLGVIAGVAIWWYRCRKYTSLEAGDFDLDVESEHEYINSQVDAEDSDADREDTDPQSPVDEDSRALLPKTG
ncbi:arylsulfotransferase [Aspergillus saccharolyticus JOP 1030-1]|uniref:Arylsulfotransferase n=1 Tax=Aspergillus saccharolyticus JOP 1030-1 TaxID=1450539 RepID=A0A318ZEL7_9EURO|nr:arylsulfotransferase [Aspergillus saccharolyticus JOP 1030-1]PYH43073.1 arylsulfotransferase [Aspergillus saccharolyticus JOP 1030-1]